MRLSVKQTEGRDLAAELSVLAGQRNVVLDAIASTIVGQEEPIELMLAALLAGGHCLLVGVPGLAKTRMARALASCLDLSFRRIQFTPDLMPSDITGTDVVHDLPEGGREFRFARGPIFANVVLADEINRTPPKTQAAMLEAMQERQVSVSRKTLKLELPFFVIATQNPIEQEGTYELPEAQLDRFMFDVHLEYPPLTHEEQILAASGAQDGADSISAVLNSEDILHAQKLVGRVAASNYVVSYVARIIRSTRPDDELAPRFIREFVEWGVGPRGGQMLIMGAKALAAMEGRATISAADVRRLALPALRHRIATSFQAQAEGITTVDIIRRLLESIPEPKVPRRS